METEKLQRLERLREIVLNDAGQKVEKILHESNQAIDEIYKQTNQELDYLKNTHLKDLDKKISEKLHNARNELSRKYKKKKLKYKQNILSAIIKAIHTEITKEFQEDPEYYYQTFLSELIKDATDQTSFRDYYLIVNEEDKQFIKDHPKYLEKFNKKISLKMDSLPPGEFGCIIENKDASVTFNNTLSKKIQAREEFLKTKLSPILFQTEALDN